jgi:nucleoid-associated protein YgaU
MSIFYGSRYRFEAPIQVTDVNGEVESVFPLRETSVDAPVGSTRYYVQAGETFESLAFRFYGDGNKWYILADANPQIFWPLSLESGVEIIIPPRSYAELN